MAKHYVLTVEDRKRGVLARRANVAATKRLKSAFRREFDIMEREERVKLGLPAEKNRGWQTVNQMKNRIEELEVELRNAKLSKGSV